MCGGDCGVCRFRHAVQNKCDCFVALGDTRDSQVQRGLLWSGSQCCHGGLHPSRENLQLAWCGTLLSPVHRHTMIICMNASVHMIFRPCFSNRSAHYGHQQWHWRGQGQVGSPRAPQTERRQLLYQCTQFVVTHAHSSIHVTDYSERSLTAGCDCSTLHTHTCRNTHTPQQHRFQHNRRLVSLVLTQPQSKISPPSPWLHSSIITTNQSLVSAFHFVQRP